MATYGARVLRFATLPVFLKIGRCDKKTVFIMHNLYDLIVNKTFEKRHAGGFSIACYGVNKRMQLYILYI